MTSKKYNKFIGSTLTAALVATAIAPTTGLAAEETQKPFPDVELGTPYTEPIAKLKAAGVMEGYPDGTFGIRTTLTRAHAAIMFTNIRDLDTNVAAAPFADVKQGVYYTDAINAAYAADVIQGHDAESFAPNDHLTRGQMAVMMVQAYDLELVTDVELPFTDLKEDHWATPYVKTLYANGLFNGKTTADGAIAAVGENVDRGDFAILLAATDIEFGHKLGEEGPADLVVESVQAISQTIAKSTPTDLAFNINGEEYTKESFEDQYGEEGYSLKFLFNHAGLSTASGVSGKVNTDLETFKYAVEVSKDGEKVNTVTSSDFVDVKVVDATVATAVQAIQLQNKSDSKAWENATVSASDEVQIGASVFSNELGQSNSDKDENGDATAAAAALVQPEIEKITSSDVTKAYYENGKIVVLADGEVTFTVKFKGIAASKQMTVKTVATQDVTSISAKDQKVKASTAGQNATFTVLDQNKEAVRVDGTEVFYTITKSDGVEASVATSVQTDATGKVTVEVNQAEGDYAVNVYATADKQTKLGAFNVEAINVAHDAKIDNYELSFADEEKTTVDLNSVKSQSTLTVNAKASISGIEVNLPDNVQVKSSNDKILKVEAAGTLKEDGEIAVTGLKTGKANVVLYTEEGDLVTELAVLEVEVVNTAPQFTTLTLKANTKVDGYAGAGLKEAVINAVKEEVESTQIESVKTLKTDGKVLVEFKSEFGGKTIALDAAFTDVTLNGAVITAPNTLQFTFSDAVEVPEELVITLSDDHEVTVAKEDISVEGNQVTITFANDSALAGATVKIENMTGFATEKGYTVKVDIAGNGEVMQP